MLGISNLEKVLSNGQLVYFTDAICGFIRDQNVERVGLKTAST